MKEKWKNLTDKQRVGCTTLLIFFIGFCFWHPTLRIITLFILPVGTSIDGLIMMAALAIGGILALFYFIKRR